ncbi:hypothetical protein [Okeania sp.]|uniref:hypothetical protein n=1 Tax=Okeania sp. TaxID=3100323 RepID=UPI002B4ADFB5|nr:hypothetical protein [Okeania sp.]MEB3342250.1 hypothetical protein [Okeania sp.]
MANISFVFEDFNKLSKEVSEYLTFIDNLQKGKIRFIAENQGNNKPKKITKE